MQDVVIKILLLPFSLLYGLLVGLRSVAYRFGLLRSVQFDIPTIVVGNLSVGGTGKTPHTEYLVQLLQPYLQVGTLSRGYGRKTEGFLMVQPDKSAEEVGDEPLQIKRKNPEVAVAVGENRIFAIPQMLMQHPDLQTIILDDAFQHRAIKAGLNILLTEHDRPFFEDFLLPAGRLREWRSAYERADIIIVTKCPISFGEADKQKYIRQIKPLPHQNIYFSLFKYQQPYSFFSPEFSCALQKNMDVLLLSGIAKTDYLQQYLQTQAHTVRTIEYADHHFFEEKELDDLRQTYADMSAQAATEGRKVMILTTEKDATRLERHRRFLHSHQLPMWVLPATVVFHFDESRNFDAHIKSFLLQFR